VHRLVVIYRSASVITDRTKHASCARDERVTNTTNNRAALRALLTKSHTIGVDFASQTNFTFG
jgi:ribulose bisphosphate carboxylase small subunit